MRHLAAALFLVLPGLATTSAQADPLFDFKLSGDGHTIEFAIPNAPPQYDHPHAITAGFSGPGSIDGVAGLVSGFIVLSAGSGLPTLSVFSVPGTTPGTGLNLFGPPIASLVFLPVATNPVAPYPPYYFLVDSTFLPGRYVFSTLDFYRPPVTLTITEEASPGVTPEPSTWALLGTGAVGGLSGLRRRLRPKSRAALVP